MKIEIIYSQGYLYHKMSSYYVATHMTTVKFLVQGGQLPPDIPPYAQPKAIVLYKRAAESVPTREMRLFRQIFILELALPFSIDSFEFRAYEIKRDLTCITVGHIDPAWIQGIFVYSHTGLNLLQRLFANNIPRAVELRREAYEENVALKALLGEDRNFSGYALKNFIHVPFAEIKHAKQRGALWDPCAKSWFAPEGREDLLEIWPRKNIHFLKDVLYVDLVPSTCWFTNVRFCVDPADWDRLRKHVYERAQYQCECCTKRNCRLEAHERWHYDFARGVQKLMRLIALCRECHEVTHIGFAGSKGRGEEAFKQLMTVTGMNENQAERHTEEAYRLCAERNQIQWKLDLTIITDSGIKLIEKPESWERETIAQVVLKRVREAEEVSFAPSPKRMRYTPRRSICEELCSIL